MRIENDKKIFSAGYPAIVPFLMEEYRGEISFEIYSGIRKEVRLFEKSFQGRLFTERALASISSSIDPYIEAHGYERDKKGATRYYYSYEAKDREAIDTSLIQKNTCLLTKEIAESAKNRTTFSLSDLVEKGLAAFVTVIDGDVVSIATVNETLENTNCLEVTVETAVLHRGKKYAESNVAAITAYLLEQGATVAYCCRNTNTKSNKIARRVGFERVGRFYAVSAYRK